VKDDKEAAKANGVLTDAQTSLKDATSKATASLAKNGKTLDVTTTAGRSNQEALDAVANSEQGVVDATTKTTQSQTSVTAAWKTSRAELYRVAGQFGLTGAAADDYVNNHLGKIPPIVNTHVNVNIDSALANIASLNATYAALQARFNSGVHLATQAGMKIAAGANGAMHAYADGGFGSGVYSGGTPLYKFAEPETRWEAFISGKQGKERENQAIWVDAGRRLGMLGGGGQSALPPIYVQNPFTGEYLLAQVDGRAAAQVSASTRSSGLSQVMGKQAR
jgi:hypothetical protein